MQYLPGKRLLALVVGLTAAAVGSAYAQDTTETGRATIDTTAPEAGAIDTSAVDTSARDTTDTSGVQNPPGYRGMERDTTMFPDSASDSASHDTTGADTSSVGDTEHIQPEAATPRLNPSENAAGDTATQTPDSTQ